MWELTKKYFKDVWAHLWGKTDIDEKAKAIIDEAKERYEETSKEIKDVAKAVKEVGNQIGDIGGAIKGKKRRGKK